MKKLNDIAYNQDNTADFLDGSAQSLPDFGMGNDQFEVYAGKDDWQMGRAVRLVYMGGEQPLTIARIHIIDSMDGQSMGLQLWRIDLDEYQYLTTTFLRNWMSAHLHERDLTFPVKQLDPLHHMAIKWLVDNGAVVQRADAFEDGWHFNPVTDTEDLDLQTPMEGAYPVTLLIVSPRGVSRR